MQQPVQRVKGTQDVLPRGCEINDWIVARLLECFKTFGYQPVNVPILEDMELYLRRGEDSFLGALYSFKLSTRDLCLRPELTASVIRAYVEHLQQEIQPLRLCYAGPVFRYVPLQRIQQRQFTQIGVELVGADSLLADAEVIAMACHSLDQVGLQNYQVVIGHIGILRDFLDQLDVDDRLRSLLLTSVEKLPDSRAAVEAELRNLYLGFQQDPDALTDPSSVEGLSTLFKSISDDQARHVLMELLMGLGINIKGNREPEEVVERLLVKIRRQTKVSEIYTALDFIGNLAQLTGSVDDVMAAGKSLLASHQLPLETLSYLAQVVELVKAYGVDASRISLDLGLGRGLRYYTGVVFEIHHPQLESERQLSGGGRYNELVEALGGQPTSATGFSHGLERIRFALDLEAGDRAILPEVQPQALLVVTDPQRYTDGIQILQTLRQQGIRVILAVKEHDLERTLQEAKQQGIRYILLASPPGPELTLRDLQTGDDGSMSSVDVIERLRG